MSKKILGLDLGTTSIGWAFVKESENESEQSSIEQTGVRVNPLTVDEQTNFDRGKPTSINAERTLKRAARRNLQRYKQRRSNLIQILKQHGFIHEKSILAENDKNTTHSTYAFRAKAASEEVPKDVFVRILLMINKKRGYKSSRKANTEDEGQAIDGMSTAKRLYEENLTPGQLCYQLLKDRKNHLPDFYRSDLKIELEKVWNFQKQFHPEILTAAFMKEIEGKGQRGTAASFWGKYKFNTAENKGTREEKKLQAYKWRSKAINMQLNKEEVAFVITEINNNINSSSGYLGAISDRSKELYFNKETIGQHIYKQLYANSHTRLKNQVFYRQDYLDEFETIWETQSKFHEELTQDLKSEIRDVIIFYQRKLKSQKGLVSFCEFESKIIEIEKDAKRIKKTIGYKVTPKSSPIFQEFKIWQVLHNLEFTNKETKEKYIPDLETKNHLFAELNIKGNLKAENIIKIIGHTPKIWSLNYREVEGNRTAKSLYECYLKILELEGYNIKDLLKVKADKDDAVLSELHIPAIEIKEMVKSIFEALKINTAILDFAADIEGKDFEKQASYQLWHLLHSYEGDNSNTGNEKLYDLLKTKFGFTKEQAQILSNISLSNEYGSLSSKAIRKIYPFIKENNYFDASALAGYNHSSSLTKEENDTRQLKDKLDLLPKNSLRNPVVEKILNQMINVVNAIITDPSLGKPDEIRIELARELKKNAKERTEMTLRISKTQSEHENIRKSLITEFGIKNPTRNDIIRYKLYEELKINGYKTLYSNTYIPREKLFSKEFDIEHLIPKALLFDDSFSNKTICVRQENLDKGDKTAYDFIEPYFGKELFEQYCARIEMMYNAKEGGISKAKYKKLLMPASEIGEGFIERDLRNSQYIAKRAREILLQICKNVVPTTGSITARLREDWGLINIMQELNFDKYKKLGLTEMVEKKDGSFKERIIDWTKRNDHRHHAMDALTIAFTKHNHIQYLNYLNARKNEYHKMHSSVMAIEQNETELVIDNEGKKKRKFKMPLLNFREEAKKHLENVLVSCKAKNKVVTKNTNRFKTKNGEKRMVQLTPRGQFHKETVYGKLQHYVIKYEKVGARFDEPTILKVANARQRNSLLQRLRENNNDPKKAFTGKNNFDKNPIYIDPQKQFPIPEKVKLVWFDSDYTIRKEVTPDLKLDKVIDVGIRNILQKRLDEFNGVPKEAFSNLDKNPIWLNEAKGIAIKRVTISGVTNAEALHTKKDHLGKDMLDKNGKKIEVDFVSTGNNHHVAIYEDENGILQDEVIPFMTAVERARSGNPVIDKEYNCHIGWRFLFSLKQNEYFIFPSLQFDPAEIDLLNPANNKLISPNLFRVQKLASRDYIFRHHLETMLNDNKALKEYAYKRINNMTSLEKIIKVRVNHIGRIVKVGEY